jgi:hypothetical protein
MSPWQVSGSGQAGRYHLALPDDIDDSQLEHRLYATVSRPLSDKPVMPPMEYLFKELKKKHVTLQLLWYEYKQGNPTVTSTAIFVNCIKGGAKSLTSACGRSIWPVKRLSSIMPGRRFPS